MGKRVTRFQKGVNVKNIWFTKNQENACSIYTCTALHFEIDSPFMNKLKCDIIRDDMKADTNMIANKRKMKSLNIYFHTNKSDKHIKHGGV